MAFNLKARLRQAAETEKLDSERLAEQASREGEEEKHNVSTDIRPADGADLLVISNTESSADANSNGIYRVEISSEEKKWKRILYKNLLKALDLSLINSIEKEEAKTQIRNILEDLINNESIPLNRAARSRISNQVIDEIMGLGPLEPLLNDPTISDILVNSCDVVYVERAGKLMLSDVKFDNNEHLSHIIDRIVSTVGRRIDESSPMVDARLKDGSRVNAIIPPLAIDAPTLSIRRFPTDRIEMSDMIEFGSISPEIAYFLKAIAKVRLNIIISGGTGSGKTTMLNALSGYIPHSERIVTIEDSAELQLQQPHVVRLETRPPNIEGKGQITQRDLVRNSLRMRPDRIILGEIREAEALDMLQAMNTGHDGSLSTIHANTPRDATSRIENMVAMSGLNLTGLIVRRQVASAIQVIIQVERLDDGSRRLTSIQEVNGMEGEILTMSEIFQFKRFGYDKEGNLLGHHTATGLVPAFFDRFAIRGVDLDRSIFEISGE